MSRKPTRIDIKYKINEYRMLWRRYWSLYFNIKEELYMDLKAVSA